MTTKTTTTAWAHLPNAHHIDAVLADVKARPEVWKAAWGAARSAAGYAARSAAWDAAWDAAWVAAGYAILALIAWDSAADLLDLPADALRVLIDVAAPPVCHQAELLLPWAIVKQTDWSNQ